MTQDALIPKNTRAAIVAAICLLILGGLADRSLRSWRNVWGATYTPLASPLSELPERIGSYVSERDLPLDPAILDVAKVDAFVNRSYVDHARSKRITLYVGYWGRANVGMGHGPDVCYRAVGWNAEAEPHERVVPFLTSDGTSEATIALHRFSHTGPGGVERLAVAFTAAVDGRFQSSSRGEFWHRPPPLRGREGTPFLAHVQVAAPLMDSA